ncbi:hypothetical protein [Nitrosomonas mobilis]|nr:hypothetical protein [Nitrosomonas mobilis]HNO75335.1 hypothetical protein [Nitrosomonas mobilis]
MGYDAETTQREISKEKEAWMVAIGATVAFIVIGVIVWSSGMGGKY